MLKKHYNILEPLITERLSSLLSARAHIRKTVRDRLKDFLEILNIMEMADDDRLDEKLRTAPQSEADWYVARFLEQLANVLTQDDAEFRGLVDQLYSSLPPSPYSKRKRIFQMS